MFYALRSGWVMDMEGSNVPAAGVVPHFACINIFGLLAVTENPQVQRSSRVRFTVQVNTFSDKSMI